MAKMIVGITRGEVANDYPGADHSRSGVRPARRVEGRRPREGFDAGAAGGDCSEGSGEAVEGGLMSTGGSKRINSRPARIGPVSVSSMTSIMPGAGTRKLPKVRI